MHGGGVLQQREMSFDLERDDSRTGGVEIPGEMQSLHGAPSADEHGTGRVSVLRAESAADRPQHSDGALNTLPEYEQRRGDPQRREDD